MHLAVTANNLTAEDLQNDRIAQIVSSARLRKEVPVELACSEHMLSIAAVVARLTGWQTSLRRTLW
jgi:hypothetical protein